MNKKLIKSNSETHHSSFIPHPSKIASILLAAGASSRMKNCPKQLLEFCGETLLRRAAKTALASLCQPVCVVLGANAESLQAEIADLKVEITINKNWASGVASSLQAGLKTALEIDPEISAVCVMLADQPLIDWQIINRLAEMFERGEDAVVACSYAETIGVPAILARSLFEEIKDLKGDAGAKKIISKYISKSGKLSVPKAAIDIDSQQDYEHLILLCQVKPKRIICRR